MFSATYVRSYDIHKITVHAMIKDSIENRLYKAGYTTS